ncbi:MAG TPA: hypothetical protein VMV74_00900 [Bacteroidales bacterium]|nr:hypothetical protein [Bacteroidales bacterium]
MIRSGKKLTDLSNVLSSGRHHEIEKLVVSLRGAEPFEGALKLLALFYDKTEDEGLRLIISGFFNDIKEHSARSEVIEALTEVKAQSTKAMLASSCWQSGLDYSEHAVTLAKIFVEGDYITSLECFTVLDTCSAMISESDRIHIVKLLQKGTGLHDEAKKQMTGELISVLKEGGTH